MFTNHQRGFLPKISVEVKGFIYIGIKAVFLDAQTERVQVCIAFWLSGDQESMIRAIPSKDFHFSLEFQIIEYK